MNQELINELSNYVEVFWLNEKYGSNEKTDAGQQFDMNDIEEAKDRLERFSPFLMQAFPETGETDGIIESPLVEIPRMKEYLDEETHSVLAGDLWLKRDDVLNISGSVKARGGFYEVLKFAEDLASSHGLIDKHEDYSQFADDAFRTVFSEYTIVCASTGNLGLSIGIMSAKLGFNVVIHMSTDAKEWKKETLRSRGVSVVEHKDDYSRAVEIGRKEALSDPQCYFVDDEDSVTLFLGYAVAALRLEEQLKRMSVQVDEEHPLYVYLPCGVGGAPGGIAFGLKQVFGPHVHPVFAEPTHSPSMLLGTMTGKHDEISVRDIGLDNETIADGLAVGRPSRFIGRTVEALIYGFYTVKDEKLFSMLKAVYDTEKIKLEPSALAGMTGPYHLMGTTEVADNSTHIVWATGGSMVPDEVWQDDYDKG